MAEWTVFDFIDALETGLNGRAALMALSPTPKVFSSWPAEQEFTSDLIVFGYQANRTQDKPHIGPSDPSASDDLVTIEGEVIVVRPDGATAITTARSRCKELLGHVDAELKESPPSVGLQTVWARMTGSELEQFAVPTDGGAGRVCKAGFTITYKARL